MSDEQLLSQYVDLWWSAIDDFTTLLESVPEQQWATPTDLPGWDVHACAAHTAHLESILAGGPEETLQFEPGPHVKSLMAIYTEQGVLARRDRTPAELIKEIRDAATVRHDALVADPPTDASATPTVLFPGVNWDWSRLLRNRPLDVWMHEQDVRRAVEMPGGMDSPAAIHVVDYLSESMGFILAKRAQVPPGTVVRLNVEGHRPRTFAVDADGRGVELDIAEPNVTLAMDRETFIVLAGGRRTVTDGVTITGDESLGRQILDNLVVTP